MIRWLSKQAIIAAHGEQLAEHGGGIGIRDEGLLESALAKPQHLAHYSEPDMAALAAAYVYGLAKNHPFIDGNKRIAWVVCIGFLRLNGVGFNADEISATRAMLELAAGDIDEDTFAAWLRDNLSAT